jgi:hypothetical protein
MAACRRSYELHDAPEVLERITGLDDIDGGITDALVLLEEGNPGFLSAISGARCQGSISDGEVFLEFQKLGSTTTVRIS